MGRRGFAREEISRKVGEWKRYGKEAREWSDLLKPVGRVMVMRFKDLKSDEVKDFWRKVVSEKGGMGMGMISGLDHGILLLG